MKVIPAIDLRDGRCVRLYQGDFERQTDYAANPVLLASEYEAMGFDALHIVDLDGAKSGEQQNQEIVREIIGACNLSVQLGGGIRTASQLKSWINTGLARAVVGSLAITGPAQVCSLLADCGPGKIILALDVRPDRQGIPRIATHGWCRDGNMTLWQCIDQYLPAGLRHVLCTDISRDGTMRGPNLELYAELIDRYPDIHLQASGGVRHIEDLQALRDTGVHAAITGRALLDGNIGEKEIASFLLAE